jgi:hypothetical protein
MNQVLFVDMIEISPTMKGLSHLLEEEICGDVITPSAASTVAHTVAHTAAGQ